MRCLLARHALALLVALGCLTACAAAPDPGGADALIETCRPEKLAELPLRQARNFLLAPAALDGRPTTLLIDTGSETTTLTPEMAASLHLRPDPAHRRTLAGVTGPVRSASRVLPQLTLGGSVVATALSVGIGDLPSLDAAEPPVAGLLGADVLARFEVELDPPRGRMALYAPSACPGYRPWAQAVSVPFQHNRAGLIFVDAEVQGRSVRALLDTGARSSLLTPATAAGLGVTPAALAADASGPGYGLNGRSTVFHRHRFATLGLPGALAHEMPANVGDLRVPGVEMLLGADYLGPRHLWISYANGWLFLR